MSIINSDGLNTNWQLNVLRGLQAIADEVAKPLTCAEDGITICSPAAGLDVNIYGFDGATPTPVSVDSNGFVNTNASIIFPSSLAVTQDPTSDPWTVDGTIIANQGTSPWVVSGSVGVTGEVEIINAVGSPIPVTIVAPVPVINVNLDAADDQVGVYGYINGVSTTPVPLNVNAQGQVAIQDGGNSITVDAVDLDIRDLAFATDKVDVSGSTVSATITGPLGGQDCDNSLAVTLCDAQAQNLLDIKNAVTGTLTVGGTVAVTQSTSPWIVNTTSIVRTPTVLRTTGGSSIPPGARSFSILNAGSGIGSILGGTNNLLAGEEVDFVAGGNDVFGLITFNGNGVTTLVVTYVS